MAYDEGLAQIFRDDLAGEAVREQKMFGGLCFMLDGHMLCGVHSGGAMVRVGKENMGHALALPGVTPLAFTGRAMGGLVDLTDEALADDARRATLLSLARSFLRSLPPK